MLVRVTRRLKMRPMRMTKNLKTKSRRQRSVPAKRGKTNVKEAKEAASAELQGVEKEAERGEKRSARVLTMMRN